MRREREREKGRMDKLARIEREEIERSERDKRVIGRIWHER